MIFGTRINGKWLNWYEVQQLVKQKQEEYNLLKESSDEVVADLQGDLNFEKNKVSKLRSDLQYAENKVEVLEERKRELDTLNTNLANEVSTLNKKIRDLRYRIGSLSGENAKMKRQLETLPQRGKGGRFERKAPKQQAVIDMPELEQVAPQNPEEYPAVCERVAPDKQEDNQ